MLILLGVFAVGTLASFVGVIAGSGGLLTIPFLIFLGLPPQIAVATNKMGTLGGAVGSFRNYYNTSLIYWRYTLFFGIVVSAGSFAGAQLLLTTSNEIIQRLLAVVILLFLPLLFINKSLGIQHRQVSHRSELVGLILLFAISIYAGFFGAGAGTLVLYVAINFFGLTILEFRATDMIPWLLHALISFSVFAYHGLINYSYGGALLLGTVTGSYIGSKLAVKKGNTWIKPIFALVLFVLALKLFF